MCGRFTLSKDLNQVSQRFGVQVGQPDRYQPTYNAAPTQLLPVITNAQRDTLQFYRWGLIPHWAKEESIGNKMINARAETLTEKPSFRNLVDRKRCLIVSDGFYEWQKTGSRKQPYRMALNSEGLFAFAGLWESWTSRETGEIIPTFTIITTEANDLVKDVHDRMPVILLPEDEKHWLSDGLPEKDYLSLLRPYPAEKMHKHPVSDLVNSPRNNSPELLERLNSR